MKKSKKILLLLIVISLLIFFLFITQSQVQAIDANNYKPDTLTTSDAQSFFDKTSTILGVVRTIGVVVSVLVLMFTGIKYMFGSVEERSEYKKTLLPYVIGAVLLFATTTFVGIIYDWSQNLA